MFAPTDAAFAKLPAARSAVRVVPLITKELRHIIEAHMTLAKHAAHGHTHIEMHCPSCGKTALVPFGRMTAEQLSLTLAMLLASFRSASGTARLGCASTSTVIINCGMGHGLVQFFMTYRRGQDGAPRFSSLAADEARKSSASEPGAFAF